MPNLPTCIESLDDLRQYIREVLCYHDQLEVNAFHLSEEVLMRRNQPCGMRFCLHGPRSVKFSAIWDAIQNMILFYSSSGERFHTIRLHRAPALVTA